MERWSNSGVDLSERRRKQHKQHRMRQSLSRPVTIDEAEPGCCHNVFQSFVSALHICDLVGAFVMLGYGIALFLYKGGINESDINDKPPQHLFGTFIVLWSSLLILSGSMGVFGFSSPLCGRLGLKISALMALVIALWNFGLILFLIFRKQSFIDYLRSAEHQLYLTDRKIDSFEENANAWIILILLFGLAELGRFFILKRLRCNLLIHDTARRNESERNSNLRRIQAQRMWDTTVSVESRTPLLDTNEEGDELVTMEGSSDDVVGNVSSDGVINVSSTSSSWWDDPEASIDEDNNFQQQEQNKKNWYSFSWQTETIDTRVTNHSNLQGNNDKEESSNIEFAPIDEEMSTGSLRWSPVCNTSEELESDGRLDLSWVQDNDNETSS